MKTNILTFLPVLCSILAKIQISQAICPHNRIFYRSPEALNWHKEDSVQRAYSYLKRAKAATRRGINFS